MKKRYALILLFALIMCQAFAQPTTNAPTPPTRSAANVISVFSDAYTNLSGSNFFPYWGQPPVYTTPSEITISGNKILSYPDMTYQGLTFGAQNLSNMDSLHLDIWSPNLSEIEIYLSRGGGGSANEKLVTKTLTMSPTAPGTWNPINIKLTDYISQDNFPLTSIIEFKFVSKTPSRGTVYIDNIYFYTNNQLPTITGFTMPSNKKLGDASFTITAPTSNSAGAFTYSSGNTDVATISGTTVTIKGSGTAIITASQAANGSYDAGSATASLVVGFDPPTTAAPMASTPSGSVISLFSNTYTNRVIDTWSTSWDNADVSDTVIAGNDTKKYSNLVFSGTEFTGANSINATAMNFLHVDIWTPNASPLKLKLVDFGANNAFDGGDDKTSIEYVLTPAPTPGTWTSYNIPLSNFTGLDTKANLSQMLFVGSNTTVYFDNVYLSAVTTLPVALAEFKAVKAGNTAQLSWRTLSELNNKGFAVERSADGAAWAQIQFVNAAGAGIYSTVDKSPLSGVNYYRLKQVDNDGKQAYSTTALVNFAGNNAVAFSFYPNPAKAKITVALQTIQSSKASVSLVNVDGKIVKTIPLTSQQSNSNIQIAVSDIAKGNYFLVLKDGASTKSSKVLVD